MNIWLVMLLGGLITFTMRFSLIYLLAEGRFEIPETIRRALHYVPPAVLSAIILPELFLHEGALDLSLGNTRLLARLVAILVARFSKNTRLTILAGMLALFLLKLFLKGGWSPKSGDFGCRISSAKSDLHAPRLRSGGAREDFDSLYKHRV